MKPFSQLLVFVFVFLPLSVFPAGCGGGGTDCTIPVAITPESLYYDLAPLNMTWPYKITIQPLVGCQHHLVAELTITGDDAAAFSLLDPQPQPLPHDLRIAPLQVYMHFIPREERIYRCRLTMIIKDDNGSSRTVEKEVSGRGKNFCSIGQRLTTAQFDPPPGILLMAGQTSFWGPTGFSLVVTKDLRFAGIDRIGSREDASVDLTEAEWATLSGYLLDRKEALSGGYCGGCDDSGGGSINLWDEGGRLLLRSFWEESCHDNRAIDGAIEYLLQRIRELAQTVTDGDTLPPDGDQADGDPAGALSCIGGVCTDPATGLEWQQEPAEIWILRDAPNYCPMLDLDGGGWRLPTIGELRALIRGCPATEPGGECGWTDDCLSQQCISSTCAGCPFAQGPAAGCYWPHELGRFCYWRGFLSSSLVDTDIPLMWYDSGAVWPRSGWYGVYTYAVRCVRTAVPADGDGEAE